jgi:hypothetical protein
MLREPGEAKDFQSSYPRTQKKDRVLSQGKSAGERTVLTGLVARTERVDTPTGLGSVPTGLDDMPAEPGEAKYFLSMSPTKAKAKAKAPMSPRNQKRSVLEPRKSAGDGVDRTPTGLDDVPTGVDTPTGLDDVPTGLDGKSTGAVEAKVCMRQVLLGSLLALVFQLKKEVRTNAWAQTIPRMRPRH